MPMAKERRARLDIQNNGLAMVDGTADGPKQSSEQGHNRNQWYC
jgi:hypothetical protein